MQPWGMQDVSGRLGDPAYLSPFAHELYAGYMRFAHIDDGSMWELLKPNNAGVGLQVCQLFASECCDGTYFHERSDIAVYKNEYQPWLFPSIVSWSSIMTPNKKPHHAYTDNFLVDYPSVAITHGFSATEEYRWALCNINYEKETDRFSYEPNDCWFEYIEDDEVVASCIGLAPAWAVIPINDRRRIQLLSDSIKKISFNTDLHLFNECWCTIEYTPCEEDCPRNKNHKAECECQAVEKVARAIEEIYQNPPVVEDYLDADSLNLWNYAVNRFYDGWNVIHETNKLGEEWACYSQLAQSPFSALHGPNFKGQPESTNSINLAMPQVS